MSKGIYLYQLVTNFKKQQFTKKPAQLYFMNGKLDLCSLLISFTSPLPDS